MKSDVDNPAAVDSAAAIAAHVVSVNVGERRSISHNGQEVETGIWKTPVRGPVRAAGVNLAGDDQADRSVHGGPEKAIYAFPVEHYDDWRSQRPAADLSAYGAFGENLTTRGLAEGETLIGSRFRCGSVELVVTEPRMPCSKLGIRLGDTGALKHMLQTGQTGLYFGIVQEGTLQAGDALELLSVPDSGLPVSALTDLYRDKSPDATALEAALAAPHVPESWRAWIRRKLEATAG